MKANPLHFIFICPEKKDNFTKKPCLIKTPDISNTYSDGIEKEG